MEDYRKEYNARVKSKTLDMLDPQVVESQLRGSILKRAEDLVDQDAREYIDPEVYVNSYFVAEQGWYRKRLNILQDDAQWYCYSLHIYTQVLLIPKSIVLSE